MQENSKAVLQPVLTVQKQNSHQNKTYMEIIEQISKQIEKFGKLLKKLVCGMI